MKPRTLMVAGAAVAFLGMAARAEIQIVTERNRDDDAGPEFKFLKVPQPVRNDAAAQARFSIVDGRRDSNGGELLVLHDGKVPTEGDEPAANFFFRAGSEGGRLLVELDKAIEIKQVNTYSWHASTRGPQVYALYARDGNVPGFETRPQRGTAPETCGWKLLARVDTRPQTGDPGGQYGVSIADGSGTLGTSQYLLFDVARTEDADAFGNTFFSEIDVIDRDGPAADPVEAAALAPQRDIVEAEGGKYTITIDTSETPDLTEWARTKLGPLVEEWYPRLVKMLPSEGFQAPTKLSITFSKEMRGVAGTSGTRIRCGATWVRRNLEGEAKGAIFHEMVHVVQQYGRAPRSPGSTRIPGWLTEGITDYLRWYHYEPQVRGADITRRNLSRARYDASYRVTANFLNWVSQRHGQDFVARLNAAIREGRYNEDLWKTLTGQRAPELGAEWKADLEQQLSAEP